MKPDISQKVENATVTLTKKGGQGILIRNQMILTACHCIEYSIAGTMALGEYYLEGILTKKGNLKVTPIFLDPVADIAVLGGLDGQEFYEEYNQFEEFCRNTPPVKICRNKLEVDKKFKIFIYTHEKKWITGIASLGIPGSHMLWIKADEAIKGGTSGSGVINEIGEIVGIVSWTSEQDFTGGAQRPLLALPLWVCRKIYNR
jgi:hypothetical protein